MSKCRYFVISICVTTRTCVCCITNFCTCGCYYYRIVRMLSYCVYAISFNGVISFYKLIAICTIITMVCRIESYKFTALYVNYTYYCFSFVYVKKIIHSIEQLFCFIVTIKYINDCSTCCINCCASVRYKCSVFDCYICSIYC